MLKKFFKKVVKHKVIFGLVILVLVAAGVYGGYKIFTPSAGATSYVLGAVEKGTLITSVSGSGQVSASNEVTVTPKVSGEILSVSVKTGQEVAAGAVLAQLDASDAYKSVRDAKANLESAQLSLEKLQQPASGLSVLQAENSLLQAQESKEDAETALQKAYEDGFNKVADAFLDLPTVMSGLENILFAYSFEDNQQNIDWYVNQTSLTVEGERDRAVVARNAINNVYALVKKSYDQNFDHYKAASRSSDEATIEDLILETYETTKELAGLVKDTNNLVDFVQSSIESRHLPLSGTVTTQQNSLNSYTGTTNSQLLTLLSTTNTIESSRKTIESAVRSIEEKTASLADLKAGADDLDVRSQLMTITQRKSALADAQEQLADYTVTAPFAGIVAAVDAKKGDTAGSGAAIATLITSQKVAVISLNEVDVAQVKAGQKVTLTFDAISDLSITGTVAEVDALGTVSQGVVTYDVQIVFDTQDERVKSGMSVTATIMTEVKAEVLMVANSAVKSSGGEYYVEVLSALPAETASGASVTSAAAPEKKIVTIGTANDSLTEILSGLSEGDLVITRTNAATKTAETGSSSQSKSLLQSAGSGMPSGGMMRPD